MPHSEHRLPHDVRAAAQARSLAREVVGQLSPERADDFVLMTSEILTNAVRHARPEDDGRISLRFELEPHVMRAIVTDGGDDITFQNATFDSSTKCHGLQLMDLLASRWGLSRDGTKAVWFEVDTDA